MARRNLLIALMMVTLASVDTSVAQKASVPKQQDKTVLASPHVQELLLLLDTDKNGKISKQEWIKFMGTEFDRLDKARAVNSPLRNLSCRK